VSWYLGESSDPSTPVVSTANAKAHLRVSGTADDTYIASLVLAATLFVQRYTGRLIYSQSITEYVDGFPDAREMQLHVYPIESVTLSYRDTDDDLVVMDDDDYWAHINAKPAMLEAKSSWPSTENRRGAVEVEIFGGDSTTPGDIVHAIKIIVGHWYEQPDETAINIPAAARALLAQHRIFR